MLGAAGGNIKVVEILLDDGANVNAIENFDGTADKGHTALTYALDFSNDDIAKLLISKGANINAITPEGYTPLMLAARNSKDSTIVKLLLEAGAQITFDANGDSVLSQAAMSGHLERVKMLIAAGAKIDPKGASGIKALWAAIHGKNPEVVKLFLDQGIYVNSEFDHGNSMLWHAIDVGNKDIVKLLIDRGAYVNCKDETYLRTLLHHSMVQEDFGYYEITELLLETGANPNVLSGMPGLGEDHTVLDQAIKMQTWEMASEEEKAWGRKYERLLRKYGAKRKSEL